MRYYYSHDGSQKRRGPSLAERICANPKIACYEH